MAQIFSQMTLVPKGIFLATILWNLNKLILVLNVILIANERFPREIPIFVKLASTKMLKYEYMDEASGILTFHYPVYI